MISLWYVSSPNGESLLKGNFMIHLLTWTSPISASKFPPHSLYFAICWPKNADQIILCLFHNAFDDGFKQQIPELCFRMNFPFSSYVYGIFTKEKNFLSKFCTYIWRQIVKELQSCTSRRLRRNQPTDLTALILCSQFDTIFSLKTYFFWST